jgi:hypothetical protein
MGGQLATVVSPMLEPLRVGTSLAGVGPVHWLSDGKNHDGSSIPLQGRNLVYDDRDCPMTGHVTRLGLCRRLPTEVGLVALRGAQESALDVRGTFSGGGRPAESPEVRKEDLLRSSSIRREDLCLCER